VRTSCSADLAGSAGGSAGGGFPQIYDGSWIRNLGTDGVRAGQRVPPRSARSALRDASASTRQESRPRRNGGAIVTSDGSSPGRGPVAPRRYEVPTSPERIR
jgi:hypothetical protein